MAKWQPRRTSAGKQNPGATVGIPQKRHRNEHPRVKWDATKSSHPPALCTATVGMADGAADSQASTAQNAADHRSLRANRGQLRIDSLRANRSRRKSSACCPWTACGSCDACATRPSPRRTPSCANVRQATAAGVLGQWARGVTTGVPLIAVPCLIPRAGTCLIQRHPTPTWTCSKSTVRDAAASLRHAECLPIRRAGAPVRRVDIRALQRTIV